MSIGAWLKWRLLALLPVKDSGRVDRAWAAMAHALDTVDYSRGTSHLHAPVREERETRPPSGDNRAV